MFRAFHSPVVFSVFIVDVPPYSQSHSIPPVGDSMELYRLQLAPTSCLFIGQYSNVQSPDPSLSSPTPVLSQVGCWRVCGLTGSVDNGLLTKGPSINLGHLQLWQVKEMTVKSVCDIVHII